ncbi:uncharacterized protein BO97DRAFT_422757 [Aspergillus homomorphus CBS 101889]|uniref:Uncharacterized protein n=1 Tax=Aspergillus homomorphus (strain CBS 101889) TaxID=1450537 RepID=A0A395I313_ASPHC|nr:hypothetical protein BO97DRAFT_422757 [Aspergillus homomorphus CBS 101889]RAL14337.1 hypothetical protein BO97DRAFT_422757 [Aspergillus homomorphus CBS 101889]
MAESIPIPSIRLDGYDPDPARQFGIGFDFSIGIPSPAPSPSLTLTFEPDSTTPLHKEITSIPEEEEETNFLQHLQLPALHFQNPPPPPEDNTQPQPNPKDNTYIAEIPKSKAWIQTLTPYFPANKGFTIYPSIKICPVTHTMYDTVVVYSPSDHASENPSTIPSASPILTTVLGYDRPPEPDAWVRRLAVLRSEWRRGAVPGVTVYGAVWVGDEVRFYSSRGEVLGYSGVRLGDNHGDDVGGDLGDYGNMGADYGKDGGSRVDGGGEWNWDWKDGTAPMRDQRDWSCRFFEAMVEELRCSI